MNKGFSAKILVVDDEASVRESLMRVLEREGHAVVQAASAEEAMSILKRESIHLMLSDLKMPGKSGLDLLREVKRHAPETEVVLITGHGTIETAVEAIKQGASDFLAKPFKRAEIIRVLTKALEKRQLVLENKRLREELASASRQDPFIGKSAIVQEIIKLVERVAPLNSTVLITGESGTGKEIIARMLHSKSERQSSRFIAVNCGAIAENLIESELFGHVKGSFTGAFRDKDGLFKTADGGTLFLDEISTVPLNLQVKLLRALEEREVMPVGATRPLPVDARIVAASNRDLAKEVDAGRFREDLYYRLNVVGIYIPPLRERREDIPLLVQHFVHKFAVEMKKNVRSIDKKTLELFLAYMWKGNVRELENAIERAIIVCDGDTLLPRHLSQNFASVAQTDAANEELKHAVMEFEKAHIMRTLEAVGYDKKAAAKFLGTSLSSLYRKLAELDIDLSSQNPAAHSQS